MRSLKHPFSLSNFIHGSRRHSIIALMALIALFGTPQGMMAQIPVKATVSGTVTDPTGAVVRGAVVELRSATDRHTEKDTTNEAGQYLFSSVSPGTYEIVVTMPGFRKAVASSLEVGRARSYVVNFTLQVGNVAEVVEVKATAAESPLIPEQAERTQTVTILGGEEVSEKHAPVAYDALKTEPGLHLQRRLGATASGQSRLVIRGLGSTPVAGLQVLTDGRPDITVTFEHPIPELHTLENVDWVEVIQGPSPVLHGYGNTGVVSITTKRPEPGFSGYVEALGGSFGTTEDFLRFGYAGDKAFMVVAARGLRTGGHIPHTEFWAQDVNLKLGRNFTQRWSGTLALGEGKSFAEVPQPFGAPSNITFDFLEPTVDLTLTGRFNKSETSVKVWLTSLHFEREPTATGRRKSDVKEYGVKFRESLFPRPGTAVLLGTDLFFAWAQNTPAGGKRTSSPIVTEVGPYLFIQQDLAPFLRFDGGVRVTAHSEFGAEPSPDLGLIFRPGKLVRPDFLSGAALRIRGTRGFRSPTVGELFGVFGAGANPNLKPERVWQYEIGLNQKIGQRVTFDIAAFIQQGENRIRAIGIPVQFQNSGEFNHRGLETRFAAKLTDHLHVQAGTTHLKLGNDFDRGVPLHSYDFGIAYTPKRFSLTLSSRYAHRYFALFGTPQKRTRLPDYFVAHAKLGYRFSERYRAFVAIDNLTDRQYQTVVGIPMPGISAFGGLSLSF